MLSERDLQIAPVVQECVVHNTRVLSNLQTLTASLFGVGAGILGLESYAGFLFYIVFSLLITALFFALRVVSASADLRRASSGKSVTSSDGSGGLFDTSAFYRSSWEFWTGGLSNGLAGYILTWTLFYGLVRA